MAGRIRQGVHRVSAVCGGVALLLMGAADKHIIDSNLADTQLMLSASDCREANAEVSAYKTQGNN